ncbi:MAG: selenium-dependent xanthine dehydrogenase [Armatimonadetes bacterium]|nr:selenium-dependent xanthine dehydrogenase [Armatimonadota bacterium]
MPEIRFRLNGQDVCRTVRENESVLDVLRNRCGIRSLKDGCQPQGQCGCCLALVGGRAVTTCALSARKADGQDVVTLEGLSEQERELYARCFASAAGLQCGFCIPGIVMRAHHLLEKDPSPDRGAIARAIDGNLCRCTGYKKILDAIEGIARVKRGEEPLPEPAREGRLGRRLARYRAEETVLGERPYVEDLELDGMLEAAVTLSPHARARVVRIDVSRARRLPGVVAVVTAEDVPGERYYGLIHQDWPGFVAVGEEVRCVGDVLAAVAALDRHIARQAAGLVEVDYEVLSPVLDPEAALAPGASRVNPRRDNLLSRSRIIRGDVERALRESAHEVSGTWVTQRIEHLFLEPESALAAPVPEGLHLYTQGQGIFDDRRQVAAFLGVPEDRVFVELVPNGGAFGGKEDLSIQAHAALLAQVTGRPVKLTLSREQSIRMHPKRHPIRMEYTAGCDAQGRLTAVKARMLGDSGAYASVGMKVLERAAGHACGAYRVENLDVESTAAYTNNPPCGAMRGFGVNQSAFAIEGCLDQLARKVGLDGWEIRWRNALEAGDAFTTGQVVEHGVGLKKTLQAVKARYYELRDRGLSVGIACGVKNTGIGNGVVEWGKARLVVEVDGTVSIYTGYTEMGQGLLTVLVQFAVEVTGLPSEVFRPRVDSSFALDCGQTTGSRGTFFAGKAVKSAAEKLRAALDGGAHLGDLAGSIFAADEVIDDTTPLGATGRIKTHTAYSYATQLCALDSEGRVVLLVAAHDVGRVVNPDLCEGQLEGSLHMGLGYALTEELPCREGMPVSFKLRDLGVLRARDVPEMEILLVEEPEPEGPFGVKGVGEIGLVPTAAAVAGALLEFDGQPRYRLPMKETPASRALSVGRMRGSREEWR